MQNLPLISVIVPIYNVAPWLPRCLDSIVGQTYKNLEIILIDDGSTDNSLEICQTYGAKDTRIKIIHQENKGVSAARNAGLDNAQGDFIMFVDPDDWLTLDACEKLLDTQQQTQTDVVMGNFYYSRENSPNALAIEIKETSVLRIEKTVALSLLFSCHCVVWAKLYRHSVLNNSRFNLEYKLGEDVDFLFQTIEKTHTFSFSPLPIYYYYLHQGTAVWTPSISTRILTFKTWKKIALFCKKHLPKNLDKHILFTSISSAILLAITILLYDTNNQFTSSLLEVRKYMFQHLGTVFGGPFRLSAKSFLLMFVCFPLLTRFFCRTSLVHSLLEKNFQEAIKRYNKSNFPTIN